MKTPHFFLTTGCNDWGIDQDVDGYFIILGSCYLIQARGNKRFKSFDEAKTHLRNCELIKTDTPECEEHE